MFELSYGIRSNNGPLFTLEISQKMIGSTDSMETTCILDTLI